MKNIIYLLIFAFILCGCSTFDNVIAPAGNSTPIEYNRLPQENRWNWHTGLYKVSEDHKTIEEIPARQMDWHVNVNTFIDPPACQHCLQIGKPQVQADGTIKVKVSLTHPFPSQSQYTGFDVRGTILFPATRYWKMEPGYLDDGHDWIFNGLIPLYFSRSEDGGGQLLNADGFTMYLFPGFDLLPHLPISHYTKGYYASGPDPDSTINGYRVFTNDLERRMFLVGETITRTYHISPPEGEFIFGYVVDASWAAPSNMPVTDPAVDFPYWANCEDGYVVEFKQIAPFYTGTYNAEQPPYYLFDRYVTSVTILHNMLSYPIYMGNPEFYLFCPDIVVAYEHPNWGVAFGHATESPAENLAKGKQEINYGIYDAEPGEYVALLFVRLTYKDPNNPNPKQMTTPLLFQFINLQVEKGNW